MADNLSQRGQALEDYFFAQQNRTLLENLRQQESKKEIREEIARLTGIRNPETLDRLVSMNISEETLMALTLTPLVQVAWADGQMEKNEREAILQAAEDSGISRGEAAHQLLTDWLEHKPGPELFDLWKAYVEELIADLDGEATGDLREDVLSQARDVAKASGGILGLASISSAEQKVLDEMAAVFGR